MAIPDRTVKRLQSDYRDLLRKPVDYVWAHPLEENILEWHYVVRGPPDCPFEGGVYHGKLVFPSEYPMKPPAIYMLTPNGKFQSNVRLCLTMSDYHPESWSPLWTTSTVLVGLLSFLIEKNTGHFIGSEIQSEGVQRDLALKSWSHNLSDKIFCKYFPEFVEKNNDEVQLVNRFSKDDFPPLYLNGWLPVLESSALGKGQILPIFAFGNDLVAFRGASGKVTVMDAYCPHLGAHLGFGGDVIQDSVKCPFHGWVFDSTGICTKIPGLDGKILPNVNMKVYDSCEVNGYIFVWNHAKGEKPNWEIPSIKNLDENNLDRRVELKVNCRLQEIIENAADYTHFDTLHESPVVIGDPLNKNRFYNKLLEFIKIEWKVEWNPCPAPNGHQAQFINDTTLKIFGYNCMTTRTSGQVIGPAFTFNLIENKTLHLKLYMTQTIISTGPLNHKAIYRFYSNYPIIGKFIVNFIEKETIEQAERDVVMWNHKKYLYKPNIVKNEPGLKSYRRWLNQFYSIE